MLGHPVAPVISIGSDASGDFLIDALARAGCETQYVFRARDEGSPVIVEHVNISTAQHYFTANCPDTDRRFPKWHSIDEYQVGHARRALETAAVFYTDRLSPAIVQAMEAAHRAASIVVFEPAERGDNDLFERALQNVSILKVSDETIGSEISVVEAREAPILIRTHGRDGLTVSCRETHKSCPAYSAPRLVDTCGSGDMVTTGLIDRLLVQRRHRGLCSLEDVLQGLDAGQRLAAVNCAFAGARGVFHAVGANYVRSILDRGLDNEFMQLALNFGPCEGY
jgi:fructokinase